MPWSDANYRTVASRRARAVAGLSMGGFGALEYAARHPGTRRDCGACELERFLHRGNVRLHRRLRALGIRHVWGDYGPGTHDWPYWRRDLRETLPRIVHALAA